MDQPPDLIEIADAFAKHGGWRFIERTADRLIAISPDGLRIDMQRNDAPPTKKPPEPWCGVSYTVPGHSPEEVRDDGIPFAQCHRCATLWPL